MIRHHEATVLLHPPQTLSSRPEQNGFIVLHSGEIPVLALLRRGTIRVPHVPRTWGHGFAGPMPRAEIYQHKATIDPQLRPKDMH